MSKRPLIAVAALATIVVGLAGCSGGGSSGPVNTDTTVENQEMGGDLEVGTLPAMIDPMATTMRAAGLVAANVCEGLFASTSNLGYKEGLLESWEYDGDVTYVFTLRSDVTFQDGSPLTAGDVVASLERYAGSALGAPFGGLVSGIEATDDVEVTLTLAAPSGAIPALLATPDTAAYIMSAESIEGHPASDALQTLMCTGPYKLDSYTPDQSAVLSRYDDYAARSDESDGSAGEKTAWVDTITFLPSNPSNALNLLRTGGLDVQSQFPLDQVTSVTGNVKSVAIPDGSFPLLQMNTQAGAMSDQTLRQAALAAIDAGQVMAATAPSDDYYTLDSSLMPEGSPWYSTEGADQYNQADPVRSKELQAEAGYAGEPLTLLYRADETWAPVAIEQLKSAGFNIDAQVVDTATLSSRRADPSQWDFFVTGGTSYGDPLTVGFMNKDFPGWWNTPEKQELMAELAAGATQEDRLAVWNELQALIYEQVPFIRFGGRSQIDVIGANVQNYPPQIGSARGFFNVSVQPGQ